MMIPLPPHFDSDSLQPVCTLVWFSDPVKLNPWEMWAETVDWHKKPTEDLVIRGYYSEKWKTYFQKIYFQNLAFELITYEKIKVAPFKETEETQFMPFSEKEEFQKIYGRGLVIQIQIDENFKAMLKKDGWKVAKG